MYSCGCYGCSVGCDLPCRLRKQFCMYSCGNSKGIKGAGQRKAILHLLQ